jgi:hypothetical protein
MTQHESPHESQHDAVRSARPSLGRRDEPDALRPDVGPGADRKLPPEDDDTEDDDTEDDDTVPDQPGRNA